MRLGEHILETFILALLESGTKNREKKFDQFKNIDQRFYFSDFKTSVSINMLLNAEHRQYFGRIRIGLIK